MIAIMAERSHGAGDRHDRGVAKAVAAREVLGHQTSRAYAAAGRLEDLGVPEEQARWLFRNGYLMRDPFSIADLMNFIGWLHDDFVSDVFAQMDALVGRVRSLTP